MTDLRHDAVQVVADAMRTSAMRFIEEGRPDVSPEALAAAILDAITSSAAFMAYVRGD